MAVVIAFVAAFVVAIKFLVDSRPGNPADSAQEADIGEEIGSKPPTPPEFPTSDYRQSDFPALRRPLIGVNYTHYAFPDCSFRKTYIPAWYHRPGVAQRVHDQLFRMRKAGISTIRTVLWHDATGQTWGPIPTAGGELQEPIRSNLIRFLSEIRRFGFARFTLAFEPERTHNPLRRAYDPAKLRENWRLVREVRSVVKRYGPRDTRFDLFSEGAPNETPTRYEPLPRQTARYIRALYRAYVSRYGNRDVTVSAIGSMKPATPTNRVQYLVRTLKSSGAALPRWYDVHIGGDPAGAAFALRQAERQLNAEGQSQPLVIGDLGYNSRGVARAIKRSFSRSGRRLDEVTPWYTHTLYGCPVTPPYRPGIYGRVLHAR
jgi:hypothetical protein